MQAPADTIRKATWLELFYDLAYVAVIAKIVHHLPDYVDEPLTYLLALLVFIPIWWGWVGHTYFANRFEREDALHTSLVLMQLFFVILLVASINPLFHGHPELFVWGYFAARMMLVVMYSRELLVSNESRPLLVKMTIGFFLGALIWLASLIFKGALQYALWVAAIFIDIVTLIVCRYDLRNTAKIHQEHLAERTGLFTIIMLGEIVVALVSYLEAAPLSIASFILMGSGFLIVVLMWWLYFYVSEPLMDDNPILESQLHGYSNLFIFLSIIVYSTAIVIWGKADNLTVFILTGTALAVFTLTLQIILGKNRIYKGHTFVNVTRYSLCLFPAVLVFICNQLDTGLAVFNFSVVAWLLIFTISKNFTLKLN